jgi:GNAT superfamily N-acetyltransferase/chorismate mutase
MRSKSFEMSTELSLRPATGGDLPALAEVHLSSRRAAGEAFPPGIHTDDEVRAWVGGWDLSAYDVWLATSGEQVAGYARCTPTWLDDLYVHPDHQGKGVGSALFDLVTTLRPDGFCLWVFESNAPARAFYRRRGCLELERTDGAANEERSPDIRVAWPGPDPVDFLRGLIDDVDLVLGDVLARRTALTRAVQAVKPTVDRDPGREAAIARRVAGVAPELGQERVARIVDVIITESLAASLDAHR